MRFHGLPAALLGTPARVAVLTALLGSPGKEWTGRGIAAEAGVSPTQAMAALRVFEAEGLCWRRYIGPSGVWMANPRHLLYDELRPVALLDRTAQRALENRLRRALKGSRADEAYLFGSVAQGLERADSDVDLFVMFPDQAAARRWRPRLEQLQDDVSRRYSTHLQALVYSRKQLRTAQRRHLLQEARTKGIRLEVRT
jgi:predicted nucleotidyltransferase